ncbi:MAG TPA: type II toxin-antitoxin system RelE/ParE family toxin [Candidatus Angelobacter sp.]|nr:type II toxin-antitoxin system RelE/ParE family toxin [Candidatus Angelobacter sp.]
MKVRWSPEAAADLTSITQYIQRENAAAALRVARIIYRGAAELDKFPLRGRPGRVNGTRELVISPLPLYCGLSHRGLSHQRELH